MSRNVLLLRHDFCCPGPRKWWSTSRDVALFSLSFFSSGCAKNLGICEAAKDSSRASSKKREREEHLWAAFGGAFRLGQPLACDVITSNAPPKDADPELRHSMDGSEWRRDKKMLVLSEWCHESHLHHVVSLKDHFPHQWINKLIKHQDVKIRHSKDYTASNHISGIVLLNSRQDLQLEHYRAAPVCSCISAVHVYRHDDF